MKIVRFKSENHFSFGVAISGQVKQLVGSPYKRLIYSGNVFAENEIKLLAPCKPSKIVAIGLNYRLHADELECNLPSHPLMFLKPPSSVIGHEEEIIHPAISQQVDFEGELGIVIGRKGHLVPVDEAGQYIFGYTCFNDITARDLQKIDGQWTRAKSFDTFACIGPWIETELSPVALKIETFLNGELKQCGNTADMIFSPIELVSAVSQVMTLEPGDVIASGTPAGIGPMEIGDVVDVKIEGVGTLRNRVSARHLFS
ncbi:MAG: fumarylacetoacetate hydrolase family protein [Dehalococcoidia bacterium]|nr:fumarylacetoacetate hydrolase family protein [Dehalococcoidia bacterium]